MSSIGTKILELDRFYQHQGVSLRHHDPCRHAIVLNTSYYMYRMVKTLPVKFFLANYKQFAKAFQQFSQLYMASHVPVCVCVCVCVCVSASKFTANYIHSKT